MRLVGPDVQKGRKRIVMNAAKTRDYLGSLFMSSNTRQVPCVL